LAEFGGEGSFGLELLFDATFATKAFKTGGAYSPTETFGCGEQGALELVDARAGAPCGRGA
jgi:hypothetical protein